MSRANVAGASVRAEARRNFADSRPLADADRFRRLAAVVGRLSWPERARFSRERLGRWAVTGALILFVGLLLVITVRCIDTQQDRTIARATSDLDLVATLLADNLDAQAHALDARSAPDVLAHALRPLPDQRGLRVFVSDESGTIIAGYPSATLPNSLADQLGTSQPLTILAEKAGVMRLTLPDGTDALATVRTLREPLGQMVAVQALDTVLAGWRTAETRTIATLTCVVVVLGALAAAYLWQAARAREADRACRSFQERVDMVLMRGRSGLWDWDLASGSIDWSASMFEIVGLLPRAKPMTFAEIDDMIHPDDGGLGAFTTPVQQGGAASIDHLFRIRGADGKWIWLQVKAQLVTGAGGSPRLVGIVIDVSETMALEEKTAKADMRLRDAIETISEAFVLWDADNRLVLCNSKFQRFHNLPPEAVAIGTPYTAVMEKGTPPLIHSQVALGEIQPMGARTFEAQLGDGRWLQINERRTKDGGYVSVGTDITTLKRNEEQLLDSERCLMSSIADLRKSRQDIELQAQQLAELAEQHREQKAEAEKANRAKSDFLANMGHELRTPLNAILGFSEIMMLESYGELGSPLYQEYSRDIHSSGQYLLNVISDVLEMSRLDAGRVRLDPKEFVLSDAVAASVATIEDAASENQIQVEWNSICEGEKLYADRTAVEKILAILLNNSVKFTPSGGRVTVRTRRGANMMSLLVEDTGVGIGPEAIARLGRPFEQCEKSLRNGMRGSGLGLSIARSLVELHGGTMKIQSQQGAGTSVLVQLPNTTPRPQLQLATRAVQPATRTSRTGRHEAMHRLPRSA